MAQGTTRDEGPSLIRLKNPPSPSSCPTSRFASTSGVALKPSLPTFPRWPVPQLCAGRLSCRLGQSASRGLSASHIGAGNGWERLGPQSYWIIVFWVSHPPPTTHTFCIPRRACPCLSLLGRLTDHSSSHHSSSPIDIPDQPLPVHCYAATLLRCPPRPDHESRRTSQPDCDSPSDGTLPRVPDR